jgi:hypothetical protein
MQNSYFKGQFRDEVWFSLLKEEWIEFRSFFRTGKIGVDRGASDNQYHVAVVPQSHTLKSFFVQHLE